MAERTRAIVMLGPPNSGKGTLSQQLASSFGMPLFLPGVIYRRLREEDTELGRTVREALADGGYCPDHLTNSIMSDEIVRLRCELDPCAVIMDGYPRSIAQLNYLTDECEVIAWVYLTAPYAVLEERSAARRECPKCGRIFSALHTRGRCHCVAEDQWKVRFDDTPQFFEKRYKTYIQQTQPIIDLIQKNYAENWIEIDTHSNKGATGDAEVFVRERVLRDYRKLTTSDRSNNVVD
jgi:adenylate kinase